MEECPKKQNAPTESGRTFLQGRVYHIIKYCQEKSLTFFKTFFTLLFSMSLRGPKTVPAQPRLC
jgi:hypothetical protein